MCNSDMQMVFGVVVTIFNVIKFVIPVILIIFCTIDFFKIIVSKKEDEIKKLQKDIMLKIVYAILVYLIPFLVPFILRVVNDLIPFDYDDSWKQCWDLVQKNKNM